MLGLTPLYGPVAKAVTASRRRDELPPDAVDYGLRQLATNTGSAIETVGKVLDTPGAIARGILAGDPMSGFSWDTERRTSGEDLLRSYGILSPDSDGYQSAGAGLLAEIATDPLSFLTLPASSLTKAGKAAKFAGILDNASLAAQKRMGADAAQTLTGRLASSAIDELVRGGKLAASEANFGVRPLVGPRLAKATTTLDEVVQASPDPTAALDKVTQYLGSKGLNYDDLADQKLGGAFGIGIGPWSAQFTPPGSETVLDAMDALGQGIAWSKPARVASAMFDKRVGGASDAADQIAAIRQFNELDAARQAGRRIASEHAQKVASLELTDAAKQQLGADSLMSPEGNDFLTRVFENKATAADRSLMRLIPGINDAVASWDRIRTNNVQQARQLGLAVDELRDPKWGTEYSPRSGTEFDFGEYGTGLGRSAFNTRTIEGLSRSPYLSTPGGTTDLREVSLLPIVREHAQLGTRSPYSMQQVGSAVADFINRKHGFDAVDQSQGEAIASVMYRLNKDLPNTYPAFAEHPLNAQSRVIISQEVARANARHVFDSLAEAAVNARASTITGSGFKRLDSALSDIASSVGLKTQDGQIVAEAKKQIVDRIAARMGVAPSSLDLSQISIPEGVYDRLKRIQDFYASPRAHEEVSGWFDSFTQLFKGALLASPARHVRDAYSNALSVWLETGDPIAAGRGFSIAKQVLGGNIDSVLPKIAKLPQYQGLANPSEIKRKFLSDVAASGVLTGLSQSDILSAKRAGEVSSLVPGMTPISRLGSFRELLPDGSRNPLQMLYDFGQVRGFSNKFETRNPLLNWSQALGDTNDSIARLGGYIAMLLKGASPEYAAQRMQSALVDYSSMTTMERQFFKKIFLWWSYQSRIGKYVVGSMLENPGGGYSQALRAMNTLQRSDDKTYVPEDLRQQFAIRIPDELKPYLGMVPKPGVTTFFKDFDFPGVDVLSLWQPRSLQGTIENLVGQANPFIKGVGELAFDKDLFTKRPLKEANTPADRLYRALTGSATGLSPVAKVIAGNIPFTQRAIGIAGGLADDRIPMQQRVYKQLLNNLSGVKIQDVDERQMLRDALRASGEDLDGVSREMLIRTIPKESLKNATPETLEKVRLNKAISKRLREANERAAMQAQDPYSILQGG